MSAPTVNKVAPATASVDLGDVERLIEALRNADERAASHYGWMDLYRKADAIAEQLKGAIRTLADTPHRLKLHFNLAADFPLSEVASYVISYTEARDHDLAEVNAHAERLQAPADEARRKALEEAELRVRSVRLPKIDDKDMTVVTRMAVGSYRQAAIVHAADAIRTLIGQPAAAPSQSVEGDCWQPINTWPHDGSVIEVQSHRVIKWVPYSKIHHQKTGHLGRWQALNEYGGWDNTRPPNDVWRPAPSPEPPARPIPAQDDTAGEAP